MLVWNHPWALCLLPLPWLCGIRRFSLSSRISLPLPLLRQRRLPLSERRIDRLGLALWFCLVLACMQPSWVGAWNFFSSPGASVMLVQDLSSSMGLHDFQKNHSRLELSQKAVLRFIQTRPSDRIGLVIFGSRAYVYVPLTLDHTMLSDRIASLHLGLVGDETALGDALHLASEKLLAQPMEERNIVLLSDGKNNSGHTHPEAFADWALTQGIRVHALGIRGARTSDSEAGFETLKALCQKTGGIFFRIEQSKDLEKSLTALSHLHLPQYPHPQPQSQLPLEALPLLVAMGLWLRAR